tara:strand:- start:186 stop:599 length:414 start_codon:yes stop_codon:yes gene_type:complete
MAYKFLEHTADVKFQAKGRTIEKAFSEAAMALKETIAGEEEIKEKTKKKIKVKGKDNEALLYNFLEEFIFLLDSEGFIFSKIKKIKINIEKGEIEAEVLGDKAREYKFTNDVKAITYNSMFVKQKKQGWEVQVVVDV